jgi:iron complex outermembrane receptor protein
VQFPLTLGTLQGLPLSGILLGNPDFKSETVLAYELGYRRRLGKSLTVDIASFLNANRRIATDQVEGVGFVPVPSPHVLATIQYRNGYKAKSGGVEAAATWKPWSRLALQGNYTWMEARTKQVDTGVVVLLNAWNTPRNAFTGTASWQMSKTWSIDGLISRVGSTPTNPPPSFDPTVVSLVGSIAAYTRVDAHISEKIGKTLEVSLGGTNLQSPRHLEFDAGTGYETPAYVPRSFVLTGKWTF